MRFILITVAIFMAIAVAEESLTTLAASWSFASTITLPDETTEWFTIVAPFVTTFTVDSFGRNETFTTTRTSISIGTEPPPCNTSIASTVLPLSDVTITDYSQPSLSPTETESSSMGPVSQPTRNTIRTLSIPSVTGLITHTHSHPQSNSINYSDILPTISESVTAASSCDEGSSSESEPTETSFFVTASESCETDVPPLTTDTTTAAVDVTTYTADGATASCDDEVTETKTIYSGAQRSRPTVSEGLVTLRRVRKGGR